MSSGETNLPLTLVLDCSTQKLFLALLEGERALAELSLDLGRPHSETLMVACNELLKLAAIELQEVRRLAVGCGPGSFSSLRIGLATMQGLAQALDIPLYGFIGLDLLAAARKPASGTIAVLTDARRHQVYWALYRHDQSGLSRLHRIGVAGPDEVAASLAGKKVLIIGNGAELYREDLRQRLPDADFAESAAWHFELAFLAGFPWRPEPGVIDGSRGRPEVSRLSLTAAPLYVRPSDAELNYRKKRP